MLGAVAKTLSVVFVVGIVDLHESLLGRAPSSAETHGVISVERIGEVNPADDVEISKYWEPFQWFAVHTSANWCGERPSLFVSRLQCLTTLGKRILYEHSIFTVELFVGSPHWQSPVMPKEHARTALYERFAATDIAQKSSHRKLLDLARLRDRIDNDICDGEMRSMANNVVLMGDPIGVVSGNNSFVSSFRSLSSIHCRTYSSNRGDKQKYKVSYGYPELGIAVRSFCFSCFSHSPLLAKTISLLLIVDGGVLIPHSAFLLWHRRNLGFAVLALGWALMFIGIVIPKQSPTSVPIGC